MYYSHCWSVSNYIGTQSPCHQEDWPPVSLAPKCKTCAFKWPDPIVSLSFKWLQKPVSQGFLKHTSFLIKLKSKQSINRISIIDQLCVKLLILPPRCVTSPPDTHPVVIVVIVLRQLHRVFVQRLCVCQCIVFLGNCLCFHFSMSLKAI